MKWNVMYWTYLYAIKLNTKATISKHKSKITRQIRENNMYNNITLSRGLVDNDERVDKES